jgi:hypothetical protein
VSAHLDAARLTLNMPPPPQCRQEKIVAGQDIVSRGRLKTPRQEDRMLQMHVLSVSDVLDACFKYFI